MVRQKSHIDIFTATVADASNMLCISSLNPSCTRVVKKIVSSQGRGAKQGDCQHPKDSPDNFIAVKKVRDRHQFNR